MMGWKARKHSTISKPLLLAHGNTLILAQEMADRELKEPSQFNPFLDSNQYQQSSPFAFEDMEKSVQRILQAIQDDEMIGVWGDFDVDGQTSTAVLVDGLARFGARISYHLPIRATESHGIDLAGFKSFIEKHQPGLVITCDTGISDVVSIAHANATGIDAIITDHHKLPGVLPAAHAIINPHQLPDKHPLSYLAGVGAAFQVVRALALACPGTLDPSDYYDLVALGTVADLAELKLENRYYTQMGLRQMARELRPALKALLTISSARAKKVSETTIGFTIAPRLNAAGRMGDANPNVDFLLSRDETQCVEIAAHLEQLNAERKLSVDNVLFSAHEMIRRTPDIAQRSAIVMHNPRWEGGVLGIAAGKLAEEYHRPAILLREEDGIIAGSARSITGVDITAAIATQRHLLTAFGGHAMAGGVKMPAENCAIFAAGLCSEVSSQSQESDRPGLSIDHFISFSQISPQLSQELDLLAPFGSGNPPPVFASRNVTIYQPRKFGAQDQHLKFSAVDINGDTAEMIWWGADSDVFQGEPVDVAYRIALDDSAGPESVYLETIKLRPVGGKEEYDIDLIDNHIEIFDLRNVPDPKQRCQKLSEEFPDLQIWYEGLPVLDGHDHFRSRHDLQPASSLAILAAPPDFYVLSEIIASTRPMRIFFFDHAQPQLSLQDLLVEIGKIIRYHLDQDRRHVILGEIASRLNQTRETARLGLLWYQAHGDIHITKISERNVTLEYGGTADPSELLMLQKKLNNSLKETAAFRDYYHRTQPKLLLRKEMTSR